MSEGARRSLPLLLAVAALVAAGLLVVFVLAPTASPARDQSSADGGETAETVEGDEGSVARSADGVHDHKDELPEGVTPEHQAFADWIVEATELSLLNRWSDVEQAIADGFRSIGDGITGWEHFVHREWYASPNILDPNKPESLVYEVHPDGSRELVSAMYLLPPGSTMDDIPPEMDSPLTPWHIHDDLCWDENQRVVGISTDGETCPRGVLRVTPPMVHVWVVDHPCGRFAALEGHGDPDDCDHAH